MKKLNITFCSDPDYSGNAKALYEYMIKRYNNNMNYTWIVYNQKTVDRLHKLGIKSILIGTDEFKKYIPKTNVFFTTHANLIGDKLKAKNSIYVELWHGIGPKPVGYLIKNQSDRDKEWYDLINNNFDYMITPSEFWRNIFASMFRLNPNRVLPLGLPLLDEIKNSNGKVNLSKLLNIDLNKYKKLILYAPTFKKGCGRDLESKFNSNNILNLKEYDEKKFLNFLKEENYLFIIKRHPSDELKYNDVENDNIKIINNKKLEENNLNVNNILNSFDLLITDYSSIGVEYSFLNKPVLYLSTDVFDYKNNREIIFDDFSFWTSGNECNNLNELMKVIKTMKFNKFENRKLFFSNLKDGGCDKICDFFFTEDCQLSYNVQKYENDYVKLMNKNNKLIRINKTYEEKIRILKKSDDELQKILHSRSYKIVQKINKIRKMVVSKK